MQIHLSTTPYEDLKDDPIHRRFRELCVRYSELGREAGVEILPFHERSNERFKTLTPAHQQGILSSLESSLDICAAAVQDGVDLRRQSLSLVWWGLRKAKLIPSSELFNRLNNNDLIEIYSLDSRQIFRSFNMFKCISYSLEELFSYEWWELFRREQPITEEIQDVVAAICKGSGEITSFDGLNHVVEEIFSLRRKRAVLQMNVIAPLYAPNGKVGGYLASSTVQSVSSMVEGGHC